MDDTYTNEPEVILVDENDRPVGTEKRLKAHEGEGQLHRAFSIFIFNAKGELLLQRRSAKKPLFAGLWTNTCCSHPLPGEKTIAAARRRLQEECGFTTELQEVFAFPYVARDTQSGLIEREFDHIFVGEFHGIPIPNPNEIDAMVWISLEELTRNVLTAPEEYTPWFRIALRRVDFCEQIARLVTPAM